ncbi:hypothetical protein, partial [Ramlibacter sp.]|uniref:hypothetical protein n=1 Tax=Ramlibacter sp. TaxID=1917967 RepID=UPI0035B361CD
APPAAGPAPAPAPAPGAAPAPGPAAPPPAGSDGGPSTLPVLSGALATSLELPLFIAVEKTRPQPLPPQGSRGTDDEENDDGAVLICR